MTGHTRISRFVTRFRERREQRQEQRFKFESARLMREQELEERRASIRTTQAKAQPSRTTSGGGVVGFGQRFVSAQAQFMQAPSARITRSPPRKAGKGRVLFTASGKPVSVRNAPTVRRRRKRATRIGEAQPQNPFAPSGLV